MADTRSQPDTGAADRSRVALVILDGWGLREPADDNAVASASTPTWDELWTSGRYPRAQIGTCGPAVGLPEGQMGNSEVGHLNLGAGRVVIQSLLRIQRSIESGEILENPVLRGAMDEARSSGGTLHLMGLVGPGGVHASDDHLDGLVRMAREYGPERVRLHAFLDGRDTPPSSAREHLRGLLERGTVDGHCRIATLSGRYFAMDRDHRWNRTELAYRAIVHGEGFRVRDPLRAMKEAYGRGETDEFVRPRVLMDREGRPIGRVEDGDVVICFNFRADRMRQITRALADPELDEVDRDGGPPRARVVTLTEYDRTLPLDVAYPPEQPEDILADVLHEHGRTSFRTAETEKYPHVTYFFNGGREAPHPGEEREIVPSPQVATYDLQPEMSAPELTRVLVEAIRSRRYDVLVCNYANPDMVGHTGDFDAAVRAVEAVDAGLGEVVRACRETDTTLLVTADHGNAEQMYDPETRGPHTAHTLNPTPLVLVEPGSRRTADGLDDGALCDIAPTILGLIDLPQPAAMTGRDLRAPLAAHATNARTDS